MDDSDRAPAPIERFDPSAYLEGSWKLVQLLPGKLLRLEQERQAHVRNARRLLAGIVVPLLLSAVLFVATESATGEMRWVTWPVIALLLGVAVLGVLSLLRGIRQVREGVRLEIDARSGKVTGFPEASTELGQTLTDLNARLVTVSVEDISGVWLDVHRGEKTKPANAKLVLALRNGTQTLQGPHAQAPDPEWKHARDQLVPLGCELARLARKPLTIRYRGAEFIVPLEQIDKLPPPPSYESLS
jgi:hypothetical protein